MLRSGNRARLLCPRRLHDSVGLALCVKPVGVRTKLGCGRRAGVRATYQSIYSLAAGHVAAVAAAVEAAAIVPRASLANAVPGANGGGRAQRGRPRAGADLPRVPPYSGAPLPSN